MVDQLVAAGRTLEAVLMKLGLEPCSVKRSEPPELVFERLLEPDAQDLGNAALGAHRAPDA
jgi:hypothetical protein